MTERELYGFLRDQHRRVLVRPAMVEMTGDFMAGALLSQARIATEIRKMSESTDK